MLHDIYFFYDKHYIIKTTSTYSKIKQKLKKELRSNKVDLVKKKRTINIKNILNEWE